MYHNQSRHQPRQQIKTYDIHPTSIKQIQRGHPWVTIDSFSEKFHPKEKFIVAANRQRPFALLLHDPIHKDVRARVWATQGNFQKMIRSFKNDLATRINKAIKKRKNSPYVKDRNHFYLIFAEADEIPGLLVHYLNGEILIQFYTDFWSQYKDYLIQTISKSVQDIFNEEITFENIWVQNRTKNKEVAKSLDFNISFKNIEIEEFGVKYKVTLGKHYDHGIYTDMASIRKRLSKCFSETSKVLNLFSYTGAFSLYALKLGAKEVTSVDLSEDYLNWLKENIALNDDIKADSHHTMAQSTKSALTSLKESGKSFNFIICDPPSSSSDGNVRTNALSDYNEILPQLYEILEDGGKALVFINTHKLSLRKFEERINRIIQKNDLNLKFTGKYYLSEDCPSKKGFPEGNYLKGLLFTKND